VVVVPTWSESGLGVETGQERRDLPGISLELFDGAQVV
jgi:hypothetical protein